MDITSMVVVGTHSIMSNLFGFKIIFDLVSVHVLREKKE